MKLSHADGYVVAHTQYNGKRYAATGRDVIDAVINSQITLSALAKASELKLQGQRAFFEAAK